MNIISRLRVSAQMAHVIRLALIVIIVSPIVVYAAYISLRPLTNGNINQGYLYGEENPGHKGIDFPASMGSEVKAIASGTVVALRENFDDNSNDPNFPFGNFVLIRHEQRHWVRQNNGQGVGQWGYVYSLYAHLKKNSVVPTLNSTVSAGNKIAEVDNTGNSSGNHLHLQIIVHQDMTPQMDPNGVDPNLGWTESSSRNGEAWIAPYNSGSTQTGTAIGLVTDTNGNSVGGLKITGIQKPAGATFGTYGYSETYTEAAENPDDILVENFATTDVAPGTYHLYAYKISDGSLYRDLGLYTFEAGRTTYVGLYPNYLPDVQNFGTGTWVSSITVRNNSQTRTAKVNTTFFWSFGQVKEQRQDSIAPKASLTFPSPATFIGSALVVGSEDLSVVVENGNGTQITNYNGIPSAGVGGDHASATLWFPSLKRSLYGRSGRLYLLNVGSADTAVAITLRGQDNGSTYPCDNTGSLAPGARLVWYPNSCKNNNNNYVPTDALYGVQLSSTSGQPLAAVLVEENDGGGLAATSNGFPAGGFTNYAPVVKYNFWGNSATLVVQNVGPASGNVTVTYYDRDSSSIWSQNNQTIDSLSSRIFTLQAAGAPAVRLLLPESAVLNPW